MGLRGGAHGPCYRGSNPPVWATRGWQLLCPRFPALALVAIFRVRCLLPYLRATLHRQCRPCCTSGSRCCHVTNPSCCRARKQQLPRRPRYSMFLSCLAGRWCSNRPSCEACVSNLAWVQPCPLLSTLALTLQTHGGGPRNSWGPSSPVVSKQV